VTGNVITLPANSKISSNGYFLINSSNSSNTAAADLTNNFSLSAGGEQLTLQDSSNLIIDTCNQAGNWFAGSDQNGGISMERISPTSDGTDSTNWHGAIGEKSGRYGTPKEGNSSPHAKEIVINEIYWYGSHEYIEIYNPQTYPIQLVNWKIYDNAGTHDIGANFTASDIIAPQSYYILMDTGAFQTTASKKELASFTLNDTGEIIKIADFNNNTIDTANSSYGGDWAAGDSKHAMERASIEEDGNKSYNWHPSTYWDSANGIYGTIGAENSKDGTGVASVSPTTGVKTGDKKDFEITFTAEADLSGGILQIGFPRGWSQPTLDSNVSGYVSVETLASSYGTPSILSKTISGNTLEIYFTSITPFQKIKVTYHNAEVQTFSGIATFKFYSKSLGGSYKPLRTQPEIDVQSNSTTEPRILINEVAFNNDNGDWVELYCLDDGNEGKGINLEGYYIDDLDGDPDKFFSFLVVKSGEYILVHYNDGVTPDEEKAIDGVINVYTADTGLTGTDEQIVLYNRSGAMLDAVCWAEDALSSSEKTDVETIVGANQWTKEYGDDTEVEGVDCVDSTQVKTNYSIMRDEKSTDTNDKKDWIATSIPTPGENNGSGPSSKAKFVITEVSMNDPDGDWVELYCLDDGNYGNGSLLSGYSFFDDSTIKTIDDDTYIKTGEFILLKFDSHTSDEKEATDGVLHLYTTDSGLTGTDEQIVFKNHLGKVLDAVCWSNNDGTLSSSEQSDIQDLIDAGEWNGTATEADCVDISTLATGGSIYRDISHYDTNDKNDWKLTSSPTPGAYNLQAGDPARIEYLSPQVILSEKYIQKYSLELLDPYGNLAINQVVTAKVSVNSHFAYLSSDDGASWNQTITLSFSGGKASFDFRAEEPGLITISLQPDVYYLKRTDLAVNVYSKPPVVINEFMYNPVSVDDSDGEWIELYNTSGETVELKGWKLKVGDSNTINFSEDEKIYPHSYLVLANELTDGSDNDTDSFATLYGNKDGVWSVKDDGFYAIDKNFSLSNSSSLTLVSPEGMEQKFVYDTDVGGDGNDHSVEKIDASILDRGDKTVDYYNWSESQLPWGTPGKVNSVTGSGIPSNLHMEHTLIDMAELGKKLILTAKIVSADGVDAATIYYKNEYTNAWKSQKMINLDGDLYQGVIPASYLNNSSLYYYIEAKDADEVKTIPENGASSPQKVVTVDMNPKLKIIPQLKGVATDEEFAVEISLENAVKLVGITLEFKYDDSVFELQDANPNREGVQLKIGSFMAAGFPEKNKDNGGLVDFVLKGLSEGVSGDGTIAIATFKLKRNVTGKYTFSFVTASVENEDGDTMSPDLFPGEVDLGGTSSDLIGPDGGVITGSDGFTLSIPSGALNRVKRIGVKKLLSGDPDLPSFPLNTDEDIISIGKAYWIQPDSLAFQKSATLTVPFSSDELSEVGLSSDDEQYLALYRYNRVSTQRKADDNPTGSWEKIGGKVDKSANTVTLNILQGGIYLLVCDKVKSSELDIREFYPTRSPFSPNGNGINDTTGIRFNVSDTAEITLRIFDVRGRLVKTLLEEEEYPSGLNEVEWDGTDNKGKVLPTGIYIMHILAKDDYDRKAHQSKTVIISRNMFE
jgi:hypothetical protein